MANKLAIVIILIVLIGIINIGFFVIKPKLTGKAIEGNLLTPIIGKANQELTTSMPLGTNAAENSKPTTTSSRTSSGRSSGSGGSSSGSSGSSGGGGSDDGSGGGGETNSNILSIESKNVNLNQEFNVSVKIESFDSIYGLEFEIFFDNNVLEANSITEGNFLKVNANTFVISNITNSIGRIKFADTRLGTQEGISGNGEIAIIRFKAIGKGNANLLFHDVKVVDNQPASVIFSAANSSINVN